MDLEDPPIELPTSPDEPLRQYEVRLMRQYDLPLPPNVPPQGQSDRMRLLQLRERQMNARVADRRKAGMQGTSASDFGINYDEREKYDQQFLQRRASGPRRSLIRGNSRPMQKRGVVLEPVREVSQKGQEYAEELEAIRMQNMRQRMKALQIRRMKSRGLA